jgi:hypothetical protein
MTGAYSSVLKLAVLARGGMLGLGVLGFEMDIYVWNASKANKTSAIVALAFYPTWVVCGTQKSEI